MEMNTVKLSDLLTNQEINEVKKFLNKRDYKGLMTYLSARREKLMRRGVLPEYLAYYLEAIMQRRLMKVV